MGLFIIGLKEKGPADIMAPNGLLFMSFKTREDRRRVLGWPAKRRFAGGEGGRMPSKAGNIKGLEKIDKKKRAL